MQSLTSMPFGSVRHPCHTPYICRFTNDLRSATEVRSSRSLRMAVQTFHRGVFEAFRNIPMASRLAASSIEHDSVCEASEARRFHVPTE